MELKLIKTVKEKDLASSMKSGAMPVLATPQMICWMEEAAFECVKPEEGYTTVGIDLNVQHLAPSPLGAEIEVIAKLVSRDAKRLSYEVEAYCNGTCIGKGAHQRAVVNIERFLSKIESH